MSVEDTLLDHLGVLEEPPGWKLSVLPEQVTDKVLRCLDDRGWIELQVWELRQRGGPTRVTGTFSPSRSPRCAGDWDKVLREYRHGEGKSQDMYCELRVSEKGKARLAELDLFREKRVTSDDLPPNPSAPMSKKDAADAWGGSMTVKKLTELMESGKVTYRQLSRQRFIFSRDNIPNLPQR